MYFIYILISLRNVKTYIGMSSKDPRTRLIEHNNNSNKWTKDNGPFKLVYFESYYCKKDALHREKFLKSGQGKRLKNIIVKYYNKD